MPTYLPLSAPPYRSANVTGAGVSSKAHYVAREDDTSRAGAVYLFSRMATDNASTSPCSSISPTSSPSSSSGPISLGDDFLQTERRYYCPTGRARGKCGWEESTKLTASDRRRGDMFGVSISVDHESGVAVVGAPGASLTGLWREVCYPHIRM